MPRGLNDDNIGEVLDAVEAPAQRDCTGCHYPDLCPRQFIVAAREGKGLSANCESMVDAA